MDRIVGKYEYVSSEGWEDCLQAVGVHLIDTKFIPPVKPVIEVEEAGGRWTLVITYDGKEARSTFRLGEPYVEVAPSGIHLNTVTTRDGNKFIYNTTFQDGKKMFRTYEFTESGISMYIVDEESGKTAKRIYKRI